MISRRCLGAFVPLLLSLLLLLLHGSASAVQDLGAASQAPATGAAGDHDVFWAIEGPDARAGYLLGTVHSEDPRLLEYTPSFLEALSSCQTYAMELVPDLPTLQRLLSYMELPAGSTLEPLVGPERFAALESAVAPYAISEARLRRMKPWAAMMTLSLPPPKTGLFLDYALSLRAGGMGMGVVGLETLEEQLAFLEDLGLEAQLDLLDQALADHEQVQAVHDGMVDAYLTRDLATLQAMTDEQMAALEPETRAWFVSEGIDARNLRMAANADRLLEGGCTFIAVGALHLPGEQGLLRLLEQAGYRLVRLPSPYVAVTGDVPASTP
ncbi:MAG: TraB/GumN family protein [Pseudomonadota bacterium]